MVETKPRKPYKDLYNHARHDLSERPPHLTLLGLLKNYYTSEQLLAVVSQATVNRELLRI